MAKDQGYKERKYSKGLLALVIFKGHPRNGQPATVRAYESDGHSGRYYLLFSDGKEEEIAEHNVVTRNAPTSIESRFIKRFSPDKERLREFKTALSQALSLQI